MERESLNSPLLSVVIPMYNCAPVIERCLDSIDCADVEIVVVNDGSTDDGVEVVERYAATHPCVRLVNKENGGASSARNLGIQEACGKYIAFVDADDHLSGGGLSRVVELAERKDADIVKYVIHNVGYGQEAPREDLFDRAMRVEVIEGRGKALERCDISDYHVVDAVFKRSVIVDNGIEFRSDLHLHEDDVFMGMFYCHASRVVVTDLPLYVYYHSSDYSSTHRQSVERQRVLIDSGHLAAEYRSAYVQAHFSRVMNLERLKYMRWVPTPMGAMKAQMTLSEYKSVLKRFEALGVWPLSYEWVGTIYYWASFKYKLKWTIKTFLTNHPGLSYMIIKLRKR